MNDISVWKNLFLVLVPLGILLLVSGLILFIKNRLFRYLVVRAGQKGLVTEKNKEKKKKRKTGPLPSFRRIKNDDRGEGMEEDTGTEALGDRGKTETLEETRSPDIREERETGTTVLDNRAQEASEKSERDDEWIPTSRSCQITKKVLVTHTKKDAENMI